MSDGKLSNHQENTAMSKGSCSDKLCDVQTDSVCSKTKTKRVIQHIETEEPKSGKPSAQLRSG